MKKILAICVFWLHVNPAYSLLVNFKNLPDIIDDNPEVQQLKSAAKKLEQRPSRLKTSFVPEVELSAGVESFDKPDVVQGTQPHYALKTSMNVYRGGADSLREEQQQLELKTYEADLASLKKNITVAAYKALANFLRFKENTLILKKMKERISDQVKRNKRNVELGQDTGTDLLHFEIKLQEVDLQIDELELMKNKHLDQFKSFLPTELQAELKTPDGLQHEHKWDQNYTLSNLDQTIFTKPEELKSKGDELNWKIAQKRGQPEVDLYAAWAQETQLHEEEFDQARQRSHKVIGVNLSLPIATLFTKQDDVETKRSQFMRQKAYERLNRKKVKNHMQSEFQRLKNLHNKLHKYEEMGKTAETYAKKVEDEYGRGVKSSADVINAYEQMAQMKMNFKKNQAEFMSLLAELFI